MSSARFEHWLAGLVLWGAYLLLKRQRATCLLAPPLVLLATAPVLYLGTAIPDWDITLLGIGWHRNPLFHSALPYFGLAWLWGKLGLTDVMSAVVGLRGELAVHVSFALGLASHLLWDIWDYGDVRWFPGGTLDRFWLGGHALLLLGLVWFPSLLLPGREPQRDML